MPTLYQLKPGFQRLLAPACRALARVGVTPNAVTLCGIALSVAGGGALLLAADPRPLLLAGGVAGPRFVPVYLAGLSVLAVITLWNRGVLRRRSGA